MTKNKYQVVGLMSGTSLDGLDIACCTFWLEQEEWHFELEHSQSLDYDSTMRERLKSTVDMSALDLLLFHNEYGIWLGDCVRDFVAEHRIRPDFVSSHGHTVFHQIDKKFTYQMGSGQELANTCSLPVVCDFRSLDVSLGGQGAPLVPIGDQLLFASFDFCLNLGGIANVSFVKEGKRLAFDNGMANMPLNYLTHQHGMSFDKGGQLARSGTLYKPLMDELNTLEYYKQPMPKSLGYEWFVSEVIPIVSRHAIDFPDQLCTLVHHVAFQIAESLKGIGASGSKMMATGGGAKNDFLIETLQAYIGDRIEVVVPDMSIVDFKESIVFALMGVLRMREETNCLSTVTGAAKDTCSGQIFYPH